MIVSSIKPHPSHEVDRVNPEPEHAQKNSFLSQILLTRNDLHCVTENTWEAAERATRLMRESREVQKLIETHLLVKTRIVQTLDAFMHHDIHVSFNFS